jgi:hemerythrin-like domain-containing protein
MSIIEMLKEDHKEVSEILDRLCETTEAAVKMREEMFDELKTALITHSKAEEKALYQTVENEDEVHDIILESFEEHALIENLLIEMSNLDVSEETWTAKLAVLKENVEHHVDEEESELLPKVKKMFSSDELDDLAEEFTQFKEEVNLEEVDLGRKPADAGERGANF